MTHGVGRDRQVFICMFVPDATDLGGRFRGFLIWCVLTRESVLIRVVDTPWGTAGTHLYCRPRTSSRNLGTKFVHSAPTIKTIKKSLFTSKNCSHSLASMTQDRVVCMYVCA